MRLWATRPLTASLWPIKQPSLFPLPLHPSRVGLIKQRVLRADTRRLAAQVQRVLAAEAPAAEAALAFGGSAPH